MNHLPSKPAIPAQRLSKSVYDCAPPRGAVKRILTTPRYSSALNNLAKIAYPGDQNVPDSIRDRLTKTKPEETKNMLEIPKFEQNKDVARKIIGKLSPFNETKCRSN